MSFIKLSYESFDVTAERIGPQDSYSDITEFPRSALGVQAILPESA